MGSELPRGGRRRDHLPAPPADAAGPRGSHPRRAGRLRPVQPGREQGGSGERPERHRPGHLCRSGRARGHQGADHRGRHPLPPARGRAAHRQRPAPQAVEAGAAQPGAERRRARALLGPHLRTGRGQGHHGRHRALGRPAPLPVPAGGPAAPCRSARSVRWGRRGSAGSPGAPGGGRPPRPAGRVRAPRDDLVATHLLVHRAGPDPGRGDRTATGPPPGSASPSSSGSPSSSSPPCGDGSAPCGTSP